MSRLPVIIGVGQSVEREEGAEARALILDAARAAGPGTIETYTVMYARDGSVERGVVIGRGAGGERFAARVGADDATTTATLASGEIEPVGLAGKVRLGDDVSQFHL